MQEIVDESTDIEICPERQHHPDRKPDSDEEKKGFPLLSHPAMIFMRLKHIVDDMIQSRSHGPIDILIGQLAQGLSRYDGLRFGEIARLLMVLHTGSRSGCSTRAMLIGFMCGLIAIANLQTSSFECKGCKNKIGIIQVHIPFAFKPMLQELMAIAIAPRLQTKDQKK